MSPDRAPRCGRVALAVAVLAASAARSAPLTAGDLLMSCDYWGIARIEPATGEQHPLGVGQSGSTSPIVVDENGLVWVVDNRWIASIDRDTGEVRLAVQVPNDFDGSNDGELLPEPGGTLLYAADGVISRIDPAAHTITPALTGAPLVKPLGLAYAANGDVLIADSGAGAVFRWNEGGVAPVASGNLLVGPSAVRQLADGDLLVLRGGRPVRVHPADGAQTLYSNAIGSMAAASVAPNGDVVYVNTTSSTNAAVSRSTSPEAAPIPLLVPGQHETVLAVRNLALAADGRIVLAGTRQDLVDDVAVDSSGAILELDPNLVLRVLSQRPPPGGIATAGDGRLFVANQHGSAFNLREVDPRTGETRWAAADPLFSRPVDAAVEADGHVLVLNGSPNGIPSVLRVDPDSGATALLSPTDQLVDPRRLAVSPSGVIFVVDFQVGLLGVSPADGAQTLVPDSDELVFPRDVEVEASGAVLVAEEAGAQLVRVDPGTGARTDVGPPLDLIQAGEEPQGFGGFSALALGLDGTPVLSLVAQSAPNDYALFRAPTNAADTIRFSELPLCRGADLEVVRAVPVPEPGAAAGAGAALAGLAFARARRRG